MTAKEALQVIRLTIEEQGPDTPNRHYGRLQHAKLIECCDIIAAAMDVDPIEQQATGLSVALASLMIEEIEHVDSIPDLVTTLENVIDRLQTRWNEEFPGAT